MKALQRKAEERNPDEFYFAMERARTKGGVHDASASSEASRANKYTQAELALMKTQDAGYVRAKAQSEARKVERMKEGLHFIGAPRMAKHKVFLDSGAEAAAFDAAEYFDTPRELLGRAYNRPRRQQLESEAAAAAAAVPDLKATAKMERRKYAAYKELAQRTERQRSLERLAAKMEAEKAVMTGRGRKVKLSAATRDSAPSFRWKAERKR